MDPTGFEKSAGLAKRSREPCGSSKSFEEFVESFLKARKMEVTAPGFVWPTWDFKGVAKLMQLLTVPTEVPTNQATNCIPYRDSISGFVPQVCHLFSRVCFVFIVLA